MALLKMYSAEKKKLETKEREDNLLKRLADIFTSEDAAKIWGYELRTTRNKLNLFHTEGLITQKKHGTWEKV